MHHASSSPALAVGALMAAVLLAGCGRSARLTVQNGMGPHPQLPAPDKSLFPTMHLSLIHI